MKHIATQRGSRSRYYTRYLAHYTKKNHMLLLLGGLFLVGVVLGTLLVRSAGQSTLELILRLLGDHARRRSEQTLIQSFTSVFTGSLGMLAAVFVCGFCAIAQPVEILVPLLRGLGFGFSAATLYAQYGTTATGQVGVLMLPGMLLSTLALLFCCNEALRLSGSLLKALQGGEKQSYSIRLYCARFIASGMLCALAALLESVLYALFPGMIC